MPNIERPSRRVLCSAKSVHSRNTHKQLSKGNGCRTRALLLCTLSLSTRCISLLSNAVHDCPCQADRRAKQRSDDGSGRGRGWVAKHRQVRLELQLPPDQVGAKREDDLIALAEQAAGVKQMSMTTLFTDLSQCGGRRPWSSTIRSLTTSSVVYSHSLRRCLVPKELFNLMGYPRSLDLGGITQRQASDLVGESMALPCVAMPLLSLLLAQRGVV